MVRADSIRCSGGCERFCVGDFPARRCNGLPLLRRLFSLSPMNDNYLTSAVVFAVVFALAGFALALAGGMMTAHGLLPEFTERCRDRLQRPIRAFFAGIATAIATLVLMGVWKALGGLGQVLMLVTGAGLFLLAVTGMAGLMLRIAERADRYGGSWRARRRAATVLALSWLLPVAGTFVLLPVCLLTGAGAAVLSLRRPSPPAPPDIPSA